MLKSKANRVHSSCLSHFFLVMYYIVVMSCNNLQRKWKLFYYSKFHQIPGCFRLVSIRHYVWINFLYKEIQVHVKIHLMLEREKEKKKKKPLAPQRHCKHLDLYITHKHIWHMCFILFISIYFGDNEVINSMFHWRLLWLKMICIVFYIVS